jgi:glutamine amidotransferase-like uncharacterized protein
MKELLIFHDVTGTSRISAEYLRFSLLQALQGHGYSCRFISAAEINDPDSTWDQPHNILVMGGGSFTFVKKILTQHGLARIQAFPHKGGTYLGICMGSYAGGHTILFQGSEGKKSNTGFAFFNDIVQGSLPITSALYDGTNRSATIVTMIHLPTGIEFPALYWGGNYFDTLAVKAHPHATPLATLRLPDATERTMGVRIDIGDRGGKAVLLGYHAETITRRQIWDWTWRFPSDPANMKRMEIELLQHPEKAYMMALACALDDMAIVPHHSFVRQIWSDAPAIQLMQDDLPTLLSGHPHMQLRTK